jgi:hypothetical protein
MVSARELPESLSGVDLGVIDALKALKEEADILRERLAGLEAVKADFDPSVFSRVHADYAKQLAGIEAKAEPMRLQARESYARLRGALNEISHAHEAVKLDRQEIELRRKLGEFNEEQYKNRLKDIETSLAERAVAHKQGEALRSRFLEVFASEEELMQGHVPPAAPAGPASTQEMPAAEEIDIPFDTESIDIPAAAIDMPAAQTQILQVLKLPEPPKVPSAAAPAAKPASFGVNATMSLRTARLVPQNPEAGRTAIPLPPKPISHGPVRLQGRLRWRSRFAKRRLLRCACSGFPGGSTLIRRRILNSPCRISLMLARAILSSIFPASAMSAAPACACC